MQAGRRRCNRTFVLRKHSLLVGAVAVVGFTI
jgi:hypothetical protein